jgi:hypothetical protein
MISLQRVSPGVHLLLWRMVAASAKMVWPLENQGELWSLVLVWLTILTILVKGISGFAR